MACLVAGHSGRVLPPLPHEVPQAAPGWRVPHVHPQRLRVAALRLCLPTGALGAPEVSQVGVHIHLHIFPSYRSPQVS